MAEVQNREELEKLLGRPVSARMFEIWRGIGIPADQSERLRKLWLSQAQQAPKQTPPKAESKEVVPQPASTFRPLPPRKPCGCKKAPAS